MNSGEKILESFELEEEPEYWFLGGLVYKKKNLSLETDSIIEYPFTTYYNVKIEPLEIDGNFYRPLAELKLPIIAFQFSDKCIAADIEPVLKRDEKTAYPFIGFNSEKEKFEIILPEKVLIKEKSSEWLGKGQKRELENPEIEEFELEFKEFESWKEAIREFYNRNLSSVRLKKSDMESKFSKAKKALFRSWDDQLGTFLQLPWREEAGFAASKYSYSLLTNEAVRLNYFEKIYRKTGDRDFKYWYNRLKELFKNKSLYKEDLGKGKGLVWYNTIDFDGEELTGEFYLGTGYYGYPGGQATTVLNLMNFLSRKRDRELEKLVKKSMEYIISTQKDDGKWPLALSQEKELPFKREDYKNYDSEGATAECVRALIKAYKFFGDEKYKESALKGLEALRTDKPICFNGLRDIGINEAEAFSSFSAINAFIDAFEEFNDEKYLDSAENYALYLLTWNYWFEFDGLDLKGINHPISETITMRISPYETLLAAETYRRISKFLKSGLWENLSQLSLKKALKMTNKSGGLSEGIFFDFEGNLDKMRTEQTFATTELIHAISEFKSNLNGDNGENGFKRKKGLKIKEKEGNLILPDLKLVFDTDKFGLESVGGKRIGSELIFKGPYSKRSKAKKGILNLMRGNKKFLLGLRDIDFIWSGIKPRKRDFKDKGFSEVDKKVNIDIRDSKANFEIETDIHKIEGYLEAFEEENKVEIRIPFEIKTKKHDLYCNRVYFRFPEFSNKGEHLEKGKIEVEMNNLSEISEETIDITKSSNWTQGGIFKGELSITVE